MFDEYVNIQAAGQLYDTALDPCFSILLRPLSGVGCSFNLLIPLTPYLHGCTAFQRLPYEPVPISIRSQDCSIASLERNSVEAHIYSWDKLIKSKNLFHSSSFCCSWSDRSASRISEGHRDVGDAAES